jgi:Asp-tRNA(Asn)/Glu-tRNA(Gln) amidotransferase A subunit family amidase
MYQVLGAPDDESLFAAPSPTLLTPSPNRKQVLGICEAWFSRATPAIQTLCRSMLDRLVAEHGYTLVDIKIPFLPEGQTAHAMTVLTDAATLLPVTKGLTPANRIMLALGNVTPSTDFLLAQKLRHVLMQHLAWLWTQHPGMIIVTPTTACAGWKVGKPVDLKYGISDGDQTLKTMEYVWMGNFCGLPSISVPAGFVVPEGRKGEGEVAEEGVQGKVPVGLMGMGEWATEEELLWFGGDCEEIGQDRSSTPPIWVDVVERAREEMKRTS